MYKKPRERIIEDVFSFKSHLDFLNMANDNFKGEIKPFTEDEIGAWQEKLDEAYSMLGELKPEEVGMSCFRYFYELKLEGSFYDVFSLAYKTLEDAVKHADEDKQSWINLNWNDGIYIRFFKKEYTL